MRAGLLVKRSMYETIATNDIKVYGEIAFSKINTCSFTARPNEHAKLFIEGYVQEDDAVRVEQMQMSGTFVRLEMGRLQRSFFPVFTGQYPSIM